MAAVGITPLHFCIFRGSNEQAIKLIEGGEADLNAGDTGGLTPMHMACYRDNVDIVRRLLEAGADGSKADGSGNTPLHAAAGAGAVGVVEVLTEKRMPLELKNAEGLTVLEVAQKYCPPRQRLTMVNMLQALVADSSYSSSTEAKAESKPTDKHDENINSTNLTISSGSAGSSSAGRSFGPVPMPRVAGVGRGRGGHEVGKTQTFPLRVARRLNVIGEEAGEVEVAEGDGARGSGEGEGGVAASGRGGDSMAAVTTAVAAWRLRLLAIQQEIEATGLDEALAIRDSLIDMLEKVDQQPDMLERRFQHLHTQTRTNELTTATTVTAQEWTDVRALLKSILERVETIAAREKRVEDGSSDSFRVGLVVGIGASLVSLVGLILIRGCSRAK